MGRKKGAEDDSWKPFKCNICGKNFIYPMNYKTHESKHKKEDCKQCLEIEPKPSTCPHIKYNCVYCNKVFLDCADYKKDQAAHKLKPECRYCKKTFRQLYSLKIHMNIHTGRRPYVCPICGYSCHSPQVLRHHELFNHVKRPAITQHTEMRGPTVPTVRSEPAAPTVRSEPAKSPEPAAASVAEVKIVKTSPVVLKRAGPSIKVAQVLKATPVARARPSIVRAGPSIVRAGPSIVRAGPSIVRAGPSIVRAGPSIVRAGPSIVRAGPSIVRAGPSIVRAGPSMIRSEPVMTRSAASAVVPPTK